MRKWLILLAAALLLPVCAWAESPLPQGVQNLLAQAHPGYEVAAHDVWGTAAAAVLAKGEERILCLAEEKSGAWQLAVDNPHALRPGETPSLLLDSDVALFWTYQDSESMQTVFTSFKKETWGAVSCMVRQVQEDGSVNETEHNWQQDHTLLSSQYTWDENENQLDHSRMAPIPAGWLAEHILLADFDLALFPVPSLYYVNSWVDNDVLARCAAELLPGCRFLSGTANRDGLEMFVEKPDGTRVLVGCLYRNGRWQRVESTPLPQGTLYGYQNFTDSLYIGGEVLVTVRPFANGGWGVEYVWPDRGEAGDAPVFMGRDWVAEDSGPFAQRYVGTHPWADMARIDWTTLPYNISQARAALNTETWAVVHNPDPADRLHLRVKNDRGAKSLGKYYNGTPVRVLSRKGDWAQVDVCGEQGWMMTKYLAFGQDMAGVTPAFPDLMTAEGQTPRVYEAASANAAWEELDASNAIVIVGLAGEEWYRVWFYETGGAGYMKQSDFWEGNG